MINCKGYAAHASSSPLQPFNFKRRSMRANDVTIDIMFCGICHSDIHQARNEWQATIYPIVPGHEIVGRVMQVGEHVTKFKPGDIVGVGCFVGSCRSCSSCLQGLEQYCELGFVGTYNSTREGGSTPTYGGYADKIIVGEDYVLKIKHTQNLAAVAPLLCAGITTYSPLVHWGVCPGMNVGIIGLGGLGHMAIKLASSFGADVTLFTTSANKAADAVRLGAHKVVDTTSSESIAALAGGLDLIINTVSATIDEPRKGEARGEEPAIDASASLSHLR